MKMLFNKKIVALLALVMMALPAMAQDAEAAGPSFLELNFNKIMMILVVCVLALFVYAVLAISNGIIRMLIDQLPAEKRAKYEQTGAPLIDFQKWNAKLWDAVPVVQEKDILLDHEYDGIRELDNHLPPWWKYMFYACIIWAVGYLFYYQVLGIGPNQYTKYEAKVEQAEEAREAYLASLSNLVDETNVTHLVDPGRLSEGKKIYVQHCVTCHGEYGEGKIGPNLTDDYSIHGSDIVDIFKVVKYGVANKMIAWGEQLDPAQMNEVSSYVKNLRGTTPPVEGKEPQGELIEDEPIENADGEEGTEGGEEAVTDTTIIASM